MSRMLLCLCLAGFVFHSLASADEKPNAAKPNGNRLTYLDEPCNPYYVHRDFPKLTTPMWVGEEGVEAVVIFGIDDMRGHEKWEAYLRPILNRLKQIDGRAPVSIMTCTIDPKHPHLQQWLEEGLSLEIHTVDHPCPLLGGMKAKGVRDQGPGVSKDAKPDAAPLASRPSALDWSKDTYDRCVDLLSEVPNNKPVCFRMPCCDSLNTLSPRFFTEIFAKTTDKGHFLQADSSVFNVFTSDDPVLPRDLVLESLMTNDQGPRTKRERFRKYIPADRFFANTIENYPYPYVIDRLCWEFPCVTPSDWSAQHLHQPHNPQTVADWKAALDCTVIKQGVFCLVFHPHNWIEPRQINELIDHAVTKHGQKVKFLTFKEAVERLNKNVLGGQTLRDEKGSDNGVRLLDVDNDGCLDVVAGNNQKSITRVWQTESAAFRVTDFPTASLPVDDVTFGAASPNGTARFFSLGNKNGHWVWRNSWVETDDLRFLTTEGRENQWTKSGKYPRFFDSDNDGESDLSMSDKHVNDRLASRSSSGIRDNGERLVDLDDDGFLDRIQSTVSEYEVDLWVESTNKNESGWHRTIFAGKRGSKPAEQELPPIVRADGSNNGFWVHSRHLIWMNEDTAKSKDLVERRSFDDLLAQNNRRAEGRQPPDDSRKAADSNKSKDVRGLTPSGSPKAGGGEARDDGPKSPEESLKLMQVKPGYRVELVAAEPLVRDPVAFDWGPDGKLWVAEMADYPLGVPDGEKNTEDTDRADQNGSNPRSSASSVLSVFPFKKGGGRVRFLEDTDGDGQYDKSTVFLDQLNFPNGVMPWRDGVLISAAPDVLFARDTNGDGRADEVKVLLTGFGEGNQQHRVNGFSWGLDNLVHCANGDSGGTIRVEGRVLRGEGEDKSNETSLAPRPSPLTPKTIDIRGRDFRWNPDTGEIDPASGQTQFGRNRDDFGNWFGNNNSNPMYHFVLDDYYTRRNPHVAPPDPKKQVSINPGPSPVFPISRTLARFNDFAMANRFTSANSAMVYRDTLLFEGAGVGGQGSEKANDKTQNTKDSSSLSSLNSRLSSPQHVFISEPVHNLVHHEVMTADGVTFTSRRPDDEQQSEFLASRDNWFRPTQIKTGPDGALYIADMYRQVIEHPQYIPPAMQEKLDLRAGHDKGRIYRVAAVTRAARDRAALPATSQMHKFSDAELVVSLSSSNGWIRDTAHRLLLWRLSEIPKGSFNRDPLGSAPADELAPQRVAVKRGDADTISALKALASRGRSSHGRLHAVSLLNRFQSLALSDFQTTLHDSHPAVRRRALQAIESFDGELPDPLINQLSGMGRDPDPFVRMQFAYTLGHLRFASLGHELGKLLYRERDDKYLVAAAMSSIHAQNVGGVVANYLEASAADANASHGNDSPTKTQLASTLLNLAATLGEDQALLSLIEYVLGGAATTESQPVMLAQMLETLDRRGTSLNQLKGIAPERLARAQQQLAARIDAARTEIANFKSQISDLKSEIVNLKSSLVIAALPLLGRVADQRGEDAKLVGELLVPQTPVPVQTAAVATLARINHEVSASALLSGWRTFTPALRTQVLDALLGRATWTDKLLDALEAKSIAPSDIDAARRQRLIAHSNAAIRTRAAKLLEVSANADRQKIVAEFASKLKESNITGEVTRGADVFKKRCAACHKLKDIGTQVGPDLVSLTDKSTAALLTAILDPNKAVEAKFLAYTAVNKQGQLFSGLIAAETGNSITLTAADGKQHTLLRADLDEFISSAKSFMPEGLEKDVSPSELADVIAFVQSSGPAPKKFDGNQPEAVMADANGGLRLLATNAEIYGKTLVFEPQLKNLGYWSSVDDRATWTINVAKPGKHSIRLNYACDNGTAGNEVVFEIAGQSVKARIVGTGSWENYQTAILGELNLSAGQHRLTVRAAETLKNHLMDLKELRLVPE
jgi:putative membrane-bound dehydrogenase-like protein